MNVQYEQRGDYLIPCARTKEQKKYIWACGRTATDSI